MKKLPIKEALAEAFKRLYVLCRLKEGSGAPVGFDIYPVMNAAREFAEISQVYVENRRRVKAARELAGSLVLPFVSSSGHPEVLAADPGAPVAPLAPGQSKSDDETSAAKVRHMVAVMRGTARQQVPCADGRVHEVGPTIADRLAACDWMARIRWGQQPQADTTNEDNSHG